MRLGTAMLAVGLLLATAVSAGSEDWPAAAAKAGLDQEAIEHLREHKVLMADEVYKQMFVPYRRRDLPRFITSDSLLNGFHVLYAESVLRLEEANARRLPEILRFLWPRLASVGTRVRADPKGLQAARRRAQIVVGTALRLLGEQPEGVDSTTRRLIEQEARKVTAARGRDQPAWLGPADAGLFFIDYSRYRPRGFYTRSDALARYFRAVAWLQSIPFRVGEDGRHDDELLSILLLGACVSPRSFRKDPQRRESYQSYFSCFRDFIGAGDDWDLFTASEVVGDARRVDLRPARLAALRRELRRRAETLGDGPLINDQVNMLGQPELGFRVLSAYRTPSAILFTRTATPQAFMSRIPTGLEVATALGSAYARSRLPQRQRETLLRTIDACRRHFHGSSVYFAYLDALAALVDEPEAAAPALLRGAPWQAKSCQTVLGGWAQLRHTWALQAKQTTYYLCEMLGGRPEGFVEPDPDFLAKMTRAVERTRTLLDEAGALDPGLSLKVYAGDLRAFADLLERHDFTQKGLKARASLGPQEKALFLREGAHFTWEEARVRPQRFFPRLIRDLRQCAEKIEHGRLTEDEERSWLRSAVNIRPLWDRLLDLCRRLEAMARKQLRGEAFNAKENELLKHYGERLAALLLYTGNDYTPRDDAPRVVDVFTLAAPGGGGSLEVGIARPRALYVLYPWRGQEVLCRGAVMPYYEFTSPKRLTDGEWRGLLDSADRPPPPRWVRPLVAGEATRESRPIPRR